MADEKRGGSRNAVVWDQAVSWSAAGANNNVSHTCFQDPALAPAGE